MPSRGPWIHLTCPPRCRLRGQVDPRSLGQGEGGGTLAHPGVCMLTHGPQPPRPAACILPRLEGSSQNCLMLSIPRAGLAGSLAPMLGQP